MAERVLITMDRPLYGMDAVVAAICKSRALYLKSNAVRTVFRDQGTSTLDQR